MPLEPNFTNILVLENGSMITRVGFASDLIPQLCFQTQDSLILQLKDWKKAQNPSKSPVRDYRDLNNINRNPVQNGIIVNWEGIIANWDYCFKALNVDPKKTAVLYLNPALNPIRNQERIAEIMFEQFEVSALLLKSRFEVICSLLSIDTGIIIEVDEDQTIFVPILQGEEMPHLIRQIKIGYSQTTPNSIPNKLIEEIYDAILHIELLLHGGIEFRNMAAQNIVISGEFSEISDLIRFLQNALIQMDSSNKKTLQKLQFHLISPSDPKNAAWIGATKFATRCDKTKWITHSSRNERKNLKKSPN